MTNSTSATKTSTTIKQKIFAVIAALVLLLWGGVAVALANGENQVGATIEYQNVTVKINGNQSINGPSGTVVDTALKKDFKFTVSVTEPDVYKIGSITASNMSGTLKPDANGFYVVPGENVTADFKVTIKTEKIPAVASVSEEEKTDAVSIEQMETTTTEEQGSLTLGISENGTGNSDGDGGSDGEGVLGEENKEHEYSQDALNKLTKIENDLAAIDKQISPYKESPYADYDSVENYFRYLIDNEKITEFDIELNKLNGVRESLSDFNLYRLYEYDAYDVAWEEFECLLEDLDEAIDENNPSKYAEAYARAEYLGDFIYEYPDDYDYPDPEDEYYKEITLDFNANKLTDKIYIYLDKLYNYYEEDGLDFIYSPLKYGTKYSLPFKPTERVSDDNSLTYNITSSNLNSWTPSLIQDELGRDNQEAVILVNSDINDNGADSVAVLVENKEPISFLGWRAVVVQKSDDDTFWVREVINDTGWYDDDDFSKKTDVKIDEEDAFIVLLYNNSYIVSKDDLVSLKNQDGEEVTDPRGEFAQIEIKKNTDAGAYLNTEDDEDKGYIDRDFETNPFDIYMPIDHIAKLPNTGGMGTLLFYGLGGCMVLFAVIMLVVRRQKQVKR